jgi:hypothetical protein
LSTSEICGCEAEPDLLGLGFAMSSVGDGGSTLWYGVASQSLIVRSAVPVSAVPSPVAPFLLLLQGFFFVWPP